MAPLAIARTFPNTRRVRARMRAAEGYRRITARLTPRSARSIRPPGGLVAWDASVARMRTRAHLLLAPLAIASACSSSPSGSHTTSADGGTPGGQGGPTGSDGGAIGTTPGDSGSPTNEDGGNPGGGPAPEAGTTVTPGNGCAAALGHRRGLLHLRHAILRVADRERLQRRYVDDRRALDDRSGLEARPEGRRLRDRRGRHLRRDGPGRRPRAPPTPARATSCSARRRRRGQGGEHGRRTTASWSTRTT